MLASVPDSWIEAVSVPVTVTPLPLVAAIVPEATESWTEIVPDAASTSATDRPVS